MITIDIFHTKGKISRMSVSGHSETAARGEDIVCAGVSALTQSAVLGLERYLGRDLELEVSSGHLECALMAEPDCLTETIYQTMLLGLTEIAKQNPEAVRIIKHGR